MLRVQGRAKCARRGAGRSSSRRWLEFSESKNLTAESHEQKTNDPSTISAQEACFDFARMIFIFATRPKSEARSRIRIIISLSRLLFSGPSFSSFFFFFFSLPFPWPFLFVFFFFFFFSGFFFLVDSSRRTSGCCIHYCTSTWFCFEGYPSEEFFILIFFTHLG